MFNIDTIGTLLLLVIATNLLYGFATFAKNRKGASNKLFFGVILGVTVWCLAMVVFRATTDFGLAIFTAQLLYAAATFIPFIFLYFSFTFPEEKIILKKWQRYLVPVPFIVVLAISVWPDLLIKTIQFVPNSENIIVFNQFYHAIYGIYIMGYFSWSYLNLYNRYKISTGIVRAQTEFVILGTLISTIIGLITNLILPFFGIFALNWLGQIAVVVMVALISYAILKHHLFNVDVIAAELFTFALWGAVLLRVAISNEPKERLGNVGLLFATIILGIFLIRAVRREVSSREKIEKLAKELEAANGQLQELDRQKSEFVSIASHQLRSPLTAIKGYSSMLLEGSFGKLTKKVEGAVHTVFDSSQSLVVVIDNFLNLSRIEQGRMTYDFVPTELKEYVRGIVNQLLPNAEKKGLKVTYEAPEKIDFTVNIDPDKMRQVILNIIDNSIKYTPTGWLKVALSRTVGGDISITVSDSGIGMSERTIAKLFKKFSRADNANKTNASGSGLGMYLAAQIMEAHGGAVRAESDGEGKGSRFIIEFPHKG